ncbi:MAG: pentapeptide repeat-containing protein [Treponema sp.]|nr:pentapeptide repeat-containing protein [Treponema sp.]
MAKKSTTAASSGNKTKTVYTVASGAAFTHSGVIYGAGDEITKAAFSDEKDFSRMVEKKLIVAKEVPADESGDDGDKADKTDGTNTGDGNPDGTNTGDGNPDGTNTGDGNPDGTNTGDGSDAGDENGGES